MGSITQKSEILDFLDFSDKISDYNEHKQLSQQVNLPHKFSAINPNKSQRCAQCGDYLVFDSYQNKETGEIKKTLASARFCKVRWCPMCAWNKAKKIANQTKSIFSQIEAKQGARGVKYLFLTLTIKNPPLNELRATIDKMSLAFKLLTKEPRFKRNILGYIRAIEFMGDNTAEGEAHPHYHCILIVDEKGYTSTNYIRQAEWVKMWQKCLKVDYTPIVDIRKIKPKNKKYEASDSAVFETIKYAVAPLELARQSQDDFFMLDQQTKNVRQYNKGGLCKSIKPIDDEALDPEIWELMESEYYAWVQERGGYVKN